MKYIDEYLREVMKVEPLGKVTLADSGESKGTGCAVLIDGKDVGIDVWWQDYAKWLEKKYEAIPPIL